MRKESCEQYVAPSFQVVEFFTEGILCASVGNEDVGEEEGNGSFN